MNLQNKYVAYLDVLGFKELVNKRNTNTLKAYFDTIKNVLNLIRIDKKNIESLLVSDSTILISPDSKEDFKTLLRAVQTIQFELVKQDIWIRGAISYGEVYFDQESNLIVGKGLVNAYLLESSAKFPRVIIDTSIIPKIADDRQEFFEFVNPDNTNFRNDKLKLVHNWHKFTDEDNFYVSYAHRIILDSIEKRNLHLIYNKIKKNLYSDPKQYDKFLWVKKYFMDVLFDLEERWASISLDSTLEKDNRIYLKKWWIKFTEM
ncbi:MAG TPA: hypothetical protein PK649_01110 [Vicingus sp.]|nr:hypothetical protein [Vicingus sp.]HRP60643.1 hypothetical protein [Vicingus sp.]